MSTYLDPLEGEDWQKQGMTVGTWQLFLVALDSDPPCNML